MASNGKPQFVKNIFLQQSKGGLAAAVNASVRQDKTALTRGSPAADQPEPRQNPAQSHPLNNNPQRSKKHGSTKRKTVHLVLWVKPIIKTELQRIAQQEGLSLSKAAGTMLARALDGHMDRNYHALLAPVIVGESCRLAPPYATSSFYSQYPSQIPAQSCLSER